MVKTFSTKMDARVVRLLDEFCKNHHLKKSSLVEEIIKEGIRQREETMMLAESIRLGLGQEREGNLYTSGEVEDLVFGKKKAR